MTDWHSTQPIQSLSLVWRMQKFFHLFDDFPLFFFFHYSLISTKLPTSTGSHIIFEAHSVINTIHINQIRKAERAFWDFVEFNFFFIFFFSVFLLQICLFIFAMICWSSTDYRFIIDGFQAAFHNSTFELLKWLPTPDQSPQLQWIFSPENADSDRSRRKQFYWFFKIFISFALVFWKRDDDGDDNGDEVDDEDDDDEDTSANNNKNWYFHNDNITIDRLNCSYFVFGSWLISTWPHHGHPLRLAFHCLWLKCALFQSSVHFQ